MKVDPRTKLILVALLTTLSVLAVDIVYLFAAVVFVAIVSSILKVNIKRAFSRLRHLVTIIVFIAVVQSLSVKTGKPLVYIGNFYLITTGGLLNGGEFALRMTIIIMASLIAASSNSKEMVDGLIKMKIPYEIAFMTSITLRFLPVFRDEFSSRLNALALRGVDIKKEGLIKKIKIYSYLIAPTVSGSVVRSRQLSRSIEARGFRAYPQRTMFRELKLKTVDYVMISIVAIIFVSYLVVMYTFGGLL